MSNTTFDAESSLEAIRQQRSMLRNKGKSRSSKLDKFTFEIKSLVRAGSSCVEIQHWLKTEKGINVALSTVTRWLKINEIR